MEMPTEKALEGDVIYVLQGCSAPVVLHPAVPHYQVVGDAYGGDNAQRSFRRYGQGADWIGRVLALLDLV
jgi:hypothetical protein